MNCPICGSRLEPGAAYCTSCGARVDAPEQNAAPGPQTYEPSQPAQESAASPDFEQPSPGQTPPYGQPGYGQGAYPPPYGAPQPAPMFDPTVNPYYAREFANISQTGRSRFNWAAFFLGPYQALYRGHTKRFLTFFLPVILASAASSLWFASAFYKMVGMAIVDPWYEPDEAQLLSLGIGMLLICLVGLVTLILYIVNGFTFNKSYYHARMGDPHVPAHGGRVAILIVLCVVFGIATSVISGASMFDALADTDWDTPYSYEDPYDESIGGDSYSDPSVIPVAGAGLDDVLSQYSFVTSDQTYYFGYNDPDASDDVSLVSSSMLFCSDDVTFEDALAAGCTDTWWESYTPDESVPDDGSRYFTFYGTLGGDDIAFDAMVGGGNFILIQAYEWNGTEYAALSEDQMCALVAYLYACAGSSDTALAYEVRGIWATDSGEDFLLDSALLNGSPYILWFISDDILAVYLDGTTDVSGEYYMMLGDDDILNVWQYDEAGNIVSDMYYSRIG